MESSRLTQLGLTENQAKAYLKLCENPNITAGELAKRISIDRSFVYNILESLSKKGLVSYTIKQNKKFFHTTDPENLLKTLEEKQELAKHIIEELKTLQGEEQKIIQVYEGKAGLRAYAREMIEAKTVYTLGGGGKPNVLKHLEYELPHFFQQMKKKRTSGKLIASFENKKIWQENLKESNIIIRGLPEGKSESSLTLADEKIIISTETNEPKVIIIQDKELLKFFKNYFDLLWKIAK